MHVYTWLHVEYVPLMLTFLERFFCAFGGGGRRLELSLCLSDGQVGKRF